MLPAGETTASVAFTWPVLIVVSGYCVVGLVARSRPVSVNASSSTSPLGGLVARAGRVGCSGRKVPVKAYDHLKVEL